MYECTVPILYRHIDISSHRTTCDDLVDLRGFLFISPQHENNVRRQNAFIETILGLPSLGGFVSSLTWTIYPRQGTRRNQFVDHKRMWEAWKLLIKIRRLDLHSLAGDWRDFVDFSAPIDHQCFSVPSAIITPAVFPEATSIRIGGLMPYNYFRACVSTPSIIASLEMENLQGLRQPRDGCHLFVHLVLPWNMDDDFWRDHTRYEETDDEDGIPILRHGGPMSGHLQPLFGKFVQLKHLKISTVGHEFCRDVRWSETREKKRYSEIAKFIKSVAPTLINFDFEQGAALETIEGWQVEPYKSILTQSRRPMDDYFSEFILPALLGGNWSQLRRLSIRGVCENVRIETRRWVENVDFTPDIPDMIEYAMHQLRLAMSNSVELTLEREAGRLFRMASLNIYRS